MNLQPKVVKPRVVHTRMRALPGWTVWCPCRFMPLNFGAPYATQPEAFSLALAHARREHWTPEVAR